MPCLVFYDLDEKRVVDQIYGGEKYLAHNDDGVVTCLVTNYFGLHDTKFTSVGHGKFMKKSFDLQNRIALKKRRLGQVDIQLNHSVEAMWHLE